VCPVQDRVVILILTGDTEKGPSFSYTHEDIALDNQSGIIMLENLGPLSDASDVIELGLDANGDCTSPKGNPAENISDTRKIRYVLSNGKLVDRESLTKQWRY
jgi:hypothetical protein